MVNSRLGLLTATPARIQPPGLAPARVPLLPKLRGQLAEFLNEGSLAHLGVLTPTHLRRFAVRARATLATTLFLPAWTRWSRFDRSRRFPRCLRLTRRRICLPPDAYAPGTDHVQWARSTYLPGSRLYLKTLRTWCWNTNQLSIAYGFRPRLRPD